MTAFEKTPGSLLDYQIDWTTWLHDGEEVETSEWTSDLTIAGHTNDTTSATVWLAGGELGRAYRVTNKVSTTASRVEERSFLVRITRR